MNKIDRETRKRIFELHVDGGKSPEEILTLLGEGFSIEDIRKTCRIVPREVADTIREFQRGGITSREIYDSLYAESLVSFYQISAICAWNKIYPQLNAMRRNALRHRPNNEWIQKAGEGHSDLVNYLLNCPGIIEEGLELFGSEYRFEDGWARADLLFRDKNKNFLVVEVKQNAVSNPNNGRNGLKALEQTAGYKAALEARLRYCPLTRGMQTPVRGMLVAYEIEQNVKDAINGTGLEYLELSARGINKSNVGRLTSRINAGTNPEPFEV